jgi:hypothetical protein
MLNYQKINTVESSLKEIDLIPKFETKDIIKFNLGIAYFVILVFLLIKLLFT